MSRLRTISDKLDYIAMGKLNAEQMEYICEINQEANLKDLEIERLNNIIKEAREYIEDKSSKYKKDGNYVIPDFNYVDGRNIYEILKKENKND